MEVVNINRDIPVDFWDELKRTKKSVLFLDYDGTLAPFRIERDQAYPYEGVKPLLLEILASDCRLVFVTGRTPGELASLLSFEDMPEIWGSHGLERFYPDGRIAAFPLSTSIITALAETEHWLIGAGLEKRMEVKHGCLAVHWRGMNDGEIDNLKRLLLPRFEIAGNIDGLELKEFDGGLELRSSGSSKGKAVKTVLKEEPEDVVTAYLGDDDTDEDAFIAINNRGLSILVRKEHRPTSAAYWLKPPEQLIGFLEQWRDCVS